MFYLRLPKEVSFDLTSGRSVIWKPGYHRIVSCAKAVMEAADVIIERKLGCVGFTLVKTGPVHGTSTIEELYPELLRFAKSNNTSYESFNAGTATSVSKQDHTNKLPTNPCIEIPLIPKISGGIFLDIGERYVLCHELPSKKHPVGTVFVYTGKALLYNFKPESDFVKGSSIGLSNPHRFMKQLNKDVNMSNANHRANHSVPQPPQTGITKKDFAAELDKLSKKYLLGRHAGLNASVGATVRGSECDCGAKHTSNIHGHYDWCALKSKK